MARNMPEKKTDYKGRIALALRNIKSQPIVLLPDFILFLITYFLTISFYRYSGLSNLMSMALANGSKIELVKSFFSGNYLQIMISFLLFIFITFVFGVGTEVVKFSMIRQVIEKKKASLLNAWEGKGKYFWRVVVMKMVIYLMILASIIVLTILSTLTLYIGPSIGGFSLGWVTLVLAFLIFLFFTLGLLFRYAVMFFEDKSGIESIKASFNYLKSKTKHVFFVWLLITVAAILFGLVATLATLLLSKLQALATTTSIIYLISFITSMAAFAIKLFYSIWSQLFVFDNYKKG